jgi:hypothetical protein
LGSTLTDKQRLLKSMIKAKLAQKQGAPIDDTVEKDEPSKEDDPLGVVTEIVNEEINHFKKDKMKKFIKETIESRVSKKKIIKESIMEIFKEGLNNFLDGQYNEAIELAKTFTSNGGQMQEGIGDKFKNIAKPFIVSALLNTCTGNTAAAVESFKKITGQEPSKQELAQGLDIYQKKSGNKLNEIEVAN